MAPSREGLIAFLKAASKIVPVGVEEYLAVEKLRSLPLDPPMLAHAVPALLARNSEELQTLSDMFHEQFLGRKRGPIATTSGALWVPAGNVKPWQRRRWVKGIAFVVLTMVALGLLYTVLFVVEAASLSNQAAGGLSDAAPNR
jgi:hypothetical protein